MASEPITLLLVQEAPFDGTTNIVATRDDFAPVDAQSRQPRMWRGNFTGPGGIVPADFWGFFTTDTPKLVGVAGVADSPLSTIALIGEGGANARVQFDLRAQTQHVVMYATDKLHIKQSAGDRGLVTLTINDLGAQDHVAWAVQHQVEGIARRFRIKRTDGAAWDETITTELNLDWTLGTNKINTASVAGSGHILVRDLFDFIPEGAAAWVRVSNHAGPAEVWLVEGEDKNGFKVADNLANAQWSSRFHVGYDDLIAIKSPAPSAGRNIVVDIELSPNRTPRTWPS